MINWKNVEVQFRQLMEECIQKIKEENIQVSYDLDLYVDYLRSGIMIFVDDAEVLFDEDADDQQLIGELSIDEWAADVKKIPSLSEEDFQLEVINCFKPIVEEMHQSGSFKQLNPALPFTVNLKVTGFPDEHLILLEGDDDDELNGMESMKTMMQQNYTKAMEEDSEYRKMLENAQDQISSMYANMPGMENYQIPDMQQLAGQAMENFFDAFDDDEDDEDGGLILMKSPDCDTDEQQQRMLALGAILKVNNGEYINTLESGLDTNDILMLVEDWWGITDRESALEVLDWLKEEGHRTIYEVILHLMDKYPWYEMEQVIGKNLPDLLDIEDPDEAAETVSKALSFYRSMKEASRLFVKESLFEQPYPESLIAWDLGRMINVACWCTEAGFLDEEEAWQHIEKASGIITDTYASWRDFGINYIFGRYVWAGDKEGHDPMIDIVEFLSASEESPWKIYPFKN